jgi:curli production assembly/transport component CsgG
MRVKPTVAFVIACLALQACAGTGTRELMAEAPKIAQVTPTGLKLKNIPPPARKLEVAVYSFPDQTGQYKSNDHFSEYSRAVTQGASAFVTSALREAGGGSWFEVVERGGLQNLLQERQIITSTQQAYMGAGSTGLPPLLFAGIIIEGGVVGYDANTLTGGAGARYLGIGGDIQYRRDAVTIGMRAVSVQTGRVMESVTTTKTVYSMGGKAGAFHYVALDEILEIEMGITRNEPTSLAVREAIELAVMKLIVDGVEHGSWEFADPAAGAALVEKFNGTTKIASAEQGA